MNIQYKDEREFYDSDSEFGNYREISVGNIKPNILYRGASPCDNKHKRASCVDGLMEESGINFIMNLADTKEKIDSFINQEDFNSPYFLSLYKKNTVLLMSQGYDEKVMPLAMNMNYKSSEFRSKVAQGFRQLELFDGPYYIHCQEGKDRTGFVCIVIEALLGASYQEIVDDYMYTYKNYYKITLENDPKRYNIIKERNVDAMLEFIVGNNNYKTIDLVSAARNYLSLGGLEDTIIDSIIEKLSK
jgi:protein tyrosine/serine phosphatase